MIRRTFTIAPPLLALMALGACREAPSGDAPAAAGNATNVAEAAPAPAPTPTGSATPVSLATKDDVLDFDYQWPAEAAAIPPLDQWLRAHAEGQRKKAAAMAARDSAEAKKETYPFHTHSFSQHWSVVADTPVLLVLEAEGYTFTGGAHGMPFIATLIWDKAAGKRLATADLIDRAALARAARTPFCAALDQQRAEKRGEPVDPKAESVIPEFVQCVDMAEQEIIPISEGGKTLDIIRTVILPYEAGPYAEGSYTIELPVNDRLLAAVKPAWRKAFGPPPS